MTYPIIPCNLCTSQKGFAADAGAEASGRLENTHSRQMMFQALANLQPSHLANLALFDLAGIAAALADTDNSLQLSAER